MPWYITAVSLVIVLFSAVLHEIAHGYVALKLGDPTARERGRLTLNPLKHIDPVMTVILPVVLALAHSPVIFASARPVPVNPMFFKNPRRGMALVAAAGPLTNFSLALLGYLAALLLGGWFQSDQPVGGMQALLILALSLVLAQGIIINLVLAVFNLIPLPPLDGGRIAVGILPLPLARPLARLEPFGIYIVFLLLYSGALDPVLSRVIGFLLPQ